MPKTFHGQFFINLSGNSQTSVEIKNIGREKKKRHWSRTPVVLRLFVPVDHCGTKFPNQIVAFGKQIIDTALTLRDIWTHVEFPIDSHVINRVELFRSAFVD